MAAEERRCAVVLMNLGGPDSLDAVRPFLSNLFSDPAILDLPAVLRRPLAWLKKVVGEMRELGLMLVPIPPPTPTHPNYCDGCGCLRDCCRCHKGEVKP